MQRSSKTTLFCGNQRKSSFAGTFRFAHFAALILAILLSLSASAAIAADSPASFGLPDAREKGTRNEGSAEGTLTSTFDDSLKKDVWEFDYSLPKNSATQIWGKDFPAELGEKTANIVKIGAKISAEHAAQLSAKAEIRGTKDTQIVPLELRAGWSWAQQPVDWEKIGAVNEIVFMLNPAGDAEILKGTLSLAVEFILRAPPAPAAAPAEVLPGETKAAEAPVQAPLAPAKPRSSYSLADGLEQGIATNGTAKGTVTATYDEGVDKDVLELDYDLAPDSSTQLYVKSFPAEIASAGMNTAKIGFRVNAPEQVGQVSVRVEAKGTKGVQSFPLELKSGWNSVQEPLDWEKIGGLNEIVFTVSPASGAGAVKGTLNFALDFIKKTSSKKSGTPAGPAPAFSRLDAGEKGVFNIGPSKGLVGTDFDEETEKDVWKFDYSVPQGAVVGVWTKSYPAGLNASSVDAVKVQVKVPNAGQLSQISLKVEVKGTMGMQTLPLRLKTGWNSFRELISWNMIGELTEVVFVVSPMASEPLGDNPMWFSPTEISAENMTPAPEAKPIAGILFFDLEFGNVTFVQKHNTLIKTGIALGASLLLFLLLGLLSRLFRRIPDVAQPVIGDDGGDLAGLEISPLTRLKRDLLYGTAAVLIAGVALRIYAIGALNPLDGPFGFGFLAIGLVGALIAEFLKFGLTGKHLSPAEAFQDVLLTGLLAVSSSRLELLQAPANWGEVLMISNLTAAIALLIYHIANASSLASTGKHLRPITGALIVGTPFIFGWLLLLENITFLEKLANGITFSAISSLPAVSEFLGRILVVFIFNEALTNGISLAIQGKSLKTAKAHLWIFLVSLGVVISPTIANLGSSPAVASLPVIFRALIAILTTMFSFGGLWGEVYLITGILLDAGRRSAPTEQSISKHVMIGVKKGMCYIGILVALLYALSMLLSSPLSQKIMASAPILVGILAGAVIFPLLKTIIETFDGSIPFFERARYSYRNGTLWFRGAVAGFGFATMITHGLFQKEMPERIVFGLVIGLVASLGMSLLRDITYALKGQGRVQSWRLYLVDGFLGAFVGSAAAFYLDGLQVPVIIEKFKLYTSAGLNSVEYITYPLLNKWGRINIGSYTGGSKLLFIESLAGVINWSIAAWLFAINKVFMQSFFDKDSTPIKSFFSKAGFATLIEHMIYVLRWGLWMSPIIFTFLRMMPEPTWYNQDGAIRTLVAIYHNLTTSPEAFQAWSLKIFIYIMAFDFFRVLIWMDHMGLRVATLVNLSFMGMDKLDEKVARFIGPAAAQRYIPEGVKRFTTWGPLLIPFYLPRGQAWDYAWSTSEAMQNAARGKGLLPFLQSLTVPQIILFSALGILICTGLSALIRLLYRRALRRRIKTYELMNKVYKVTVRENGEAFSELIHKECDISRRAYDPLDPCGRAIFLADENQKPESATRYWPIAGNFPLEKFDASRIKRDGDAVKIVNTSNGIRTTIEIVLPEPESTAELWTMTVENLTAQPRQLKAVTYLEWVLNGGLHDRFHTQYARLYPEMEYVSGSNAILSWQKSTKSMGVLASDLAPEGFLTARVDFIGRARSLWSPRILETFNFLEARDTEPYPTFDPIGCLAIDFALAPKASKTVRLMVGYAKNKEAALTLVNKLLKPQITKPVPAAKTKKSPLIGHGEIPPGTPQPYSEFIDNGNKLAVRTPYTPRPYDHALSNTLHSVMVTNRGLQTSCNGNSQQNRVTPDWPDTTTKEIPVEAIYLFDPDKNEWFSPTHHPLNDFSAKNECEFGVDGTALFRMTRGSLSTELTVFVPPADPTGVYLLTVKNNGDRLRKIRIAPYFQIALAFMPERSGPLQMRQDQSLGALYFENPRNMFRSGWAFAAMSIPAERMETKRGRFFGTGRGVAHPYFVEKGTPDVTQLTDDGQIAGFLGTMEVPAHGECTVAIVLGQTEDLKHASEIVRKYKSIETVRKSLEETRAWWLSLMKTVEVKTSHPEFDYFQNWLKYQALAERIWARRGFYQTSGAFGFRDQLQDTVNLMWVNPALARKQIILHASQQFVEGDVFHWFFTLTDGRAAFSCRSHASDNPLWLAWAVCEYIRATEDDSILNEMAAYMVSEFPFAPLPKNKQGWGHLYHRSTRADSVYRHCMKSVDLVLKKRMGRNGLPLMGTGDWNDGLDEIGSEGKGESVWLGFFLYYILKEMVNIIGKKEGPKRKEYYAMRMEALKDAIEKTWRGDRYLRAFHDDGTEVGVKDSGIWEIDSLTAAWAVMSGINFERNVTVFNTALRVLEKDDTILLGWPALRENTKPYLGRSSKYPEGVRENGMYCHGVQWLVRAARILAEQFEKQGNRAKADEYRATAYRLWLKISPISHVTPQKIEIYGGQPNKQAADFLTTFDRGRMIWHGYTGAAGWMLRQAIEGVVGASLVKNEVILPPDMDKPRGELKITRFRRDLGKNPLKLVDAH